MILVLIKGNCGSTGLSFFFLFLFLFFEFMVSVLDGWYCFGVVDNIGNCFGVGEQ